MLTYTMLCSRGVLHSVILIYFICIRFLCLFAENDVNCKFQSKEYNELHIVLCYVIINALQKNDKNPIADEKCINFIH